MNWRSFFFAILLGTTLFACGPAGSRIAEIETEYGTIKVELYDDTPQHRDNFVKLVKEGYYDGLLFHRVIKNFMIQGGDPDSRGAAPSAQLGNGGPGYTIPAEITPEHIHLKGALAAARLGDQVNPEKESSGSQFYIVQGFEVKPFMFERMKLERGIEYTEAQKQAYLEQGGVPNLDMEYTVFGRVIEGQEVVDQIATVATGALDRPVQDVEMKIRMVN